MQKKTLSSFLLLALLASPLGCTAPTVLPKPEAVQTRVALTSFSGTQACADLEEYIEDVATLEMKAQMASLKNSGGFFGGGIPMAESAPANAGATQDSASSKATPTDYTTTNTQVAGVDEADFVKNDGNRIFVLSGDTLYATLSWPASQLALSGQLKLEGYPREMFLTDNNQMVVFSQVYTEWYDVAQTSSGADRAACSGFSCNAYQANAVKVTVVNVADMANMVVTNESYLPGAYANARRIGDSVRIVLSDSPRYPAGVRYYVDSSDPTIYSDQTRYNSAIDQLIIDNEQAIRQATLETWLPEVRVKKADGSVVTMARDCSQFYRSNAPTQLGLLTIATLNLANPAAIAQTHVVAQVGEVYASTQNLYISNYHWWWTNAPGQKDATYLHKFDISSPDVASYVASGAVDGHIVNQFAMDEAASGHLRIATTTRTYDASNGWWWGSNTTNQVQVLAEQQGVLTVVGQTEALAPGERIYSARFVGDDGYVVTFREVDPLYTFDLSNPLQPRKVGELKVPGFSTYIHPIDENHLLTIGTFVPEQPASWSARALQLQIFDVTDRTNPVQAHTQMVGTAYAFSEAQYEHKAFNYFAAKKTLAIPFFDWSSSAQTPSAYWNSFVSELRVYGVDTQTGFTSKGALSLADMFQQGYDEWGWSFYFQPMVRRSVMADDFVYAISDAGIRVANIASLATPVAEVAFSRTAP